MNALREVSGSVHLRDVTPASLSADDQLEAKESSVRAGTPLSNKGSQDFCVHLYCLNWERYGL